MDKLIHVQTLMRESELSELKEKTGEKETKEAIRKAVLYYIEVRGIK